MPFPATAPLRTTRAVDVFMHTRNYVKVAKHFKGNANIKLVDAGNMRLVEMKGKDERKLGLLRRCDLLVHVVRCFDLVEPKPQHQRRGGKGEGDGEGVDDAAEPEDASASWLSNLGGGVKREGEDGEEVEEEIDWPLLPTPLEDVRSTRAEMAYADLQFIEERQK